MSHGRIEEEKDIIAIMIGYYCRNKEKNQVICTDCRELIEYAQARLDHCPFGDEKTACKKCPIHCYKPVMRERMKKVMSYTGPRMLFVFPRIAFAHYFCFSCFFRSRKAK